MPSVTLARLAWHSMVHGGWSDLAQRYVFDTRELTNDRAYFTAYIKPADLPHVHQRQGRHQAGRPRQRLG